MQIKIVYYLGHALQLARCGALVVDEEVNLTVRHQAPEKKTQDCERWGKPY